MGEPWMIPTKTQLEELIKYTTSEWTNMSMIFGRKFINKTNPLKSIYIPAGGWWTQYKYESAGAKGYYWSTTYYSSPYTYRLDIDSDNAYTSEYGIVSNGLSIHPIAPPKPW